jgi:hypothetical protein
MKLSRKCITWLLLGSLLGGCEVLVSPGTRVTPRDEEAQAVGDAIDEHTQDLLIAFNVQELLLFELPLRAMSGPAVVLPDLSRGGCPTVDDDTDADGDGIPDDAVFTFLGDACAVVVDSVGSFWQSGLVHIVDSGAAPGYHLTFDDFRVRHEVFGGSDYSVMTVDGTYDVTATSSTATLVEDVSITLEERQDGETVTGNMAFALRAHFIAAQDEQLDLSIELPSGSLGVEGRVSWSFRETSFSFNVSTEKELLFDAECQEGPEFLSGEIRAMLRNGHGAVIDIRYAGCALEPEITLVQP